MAGHERHLSRIGRHLHAAKVFAGVYPLECHTGSHIHIYVEVRRQRRRRRDGAGAICGAGAAGVQFAQAGGDRCMGTMEGIGEGIERVCQGGNVRVRPDDREGAGLLGLCATGGESVRGTLIPTTCLAIGYSDV